MENAVFLSESVVRDVLINLTRDEIITIQNDLTKSLTDVSLGGEGKYQPGASHVNRPNGQRTLFRPFTSPTSVGAKMVVEPAPRPSGERPPIHGIVAVCDQDGIPTGILGAEELTGFRTALSALVPYMWRARTEKIVVFGAGMQALWHIRLALALRGSEIESLTVVNRSVSRAEALLAKVRAENEERWHSGCTFRCLDPNSANYETELEEHLSRSNAIFCTVRSTNPLFPARLVMQDGHSPFISAVGSWQSSMIELDPAILQNAASLMHSKGLGAVLSDDRGSALENSGEVVQSGIGGQGIVEVAEAFEARTQREGESERPQLCKTLEEGLIVYKCIGVSVTDLAVGNAILRIAKGKGVGVPLS